MNPKIVVYTAIFGQYGGLVEQPLFDNVDYICYTDQDFTSKTWKIIKVAPVIEDDSTRSNRYYKILPHLHLKEYEISVYIDANFLILKDFSSYVKEKLKTNTLLCFNHNKTDIDKRDCIYEEHRAILEIGEKSGNYRDSPKIMEQQIKRYRQEKFPENYGLISAGVLIRKHTDKDLINVMESWWREVKNESKRDQLSFNYVAWKLNYKKFYYLPGDIRKGNEWFRWMPHKKNYTLKVFKIKLKKKISKIKNSILGTR